MRTCHRGGGTLRLEVIVIGRFAHTKKHALEAAAEAGYELVYYEEIVPRIERGEDVKGHLFGFVLQNTSTSTSTSTRKENEGKEEL